MKSMTFKTIGLIAILGGALALPVLAQPGPGMGGGPGAMAGQSGTMGQGMRQGMGRGGRGMAFNQNNVRGWALMTSEERAAHQAKMREVKTYDECKTVQSENRAALEARAKEKGITLPAPRQNVCDNWKARGFVK